MKRIIIFSITSILILISVTGVCGWKIGQMFKGILNDDPSRFKEGYKYFSWCAGGVPLVSNLPEILNKDYVVLLQNNTELRATGGFMGSYARLRFRNGTLQSTKFEDIYEPDGQLYGYVKPPAPLDKAFENGSWKLRDSNWDPDFRVSAPQIAWFFSQGGEVVDGLVALNLTTVLKVLEVLEMPTKNLVNLAQTSAEIHKDKRGFLSTTAGEILSNLKNLKYPGLLKLLWVVYGDLRNKQILLWAKDPEVQKVITQKYWDGSLGDYINDYLYIVESNLGANKANCCIEREVTQEITSNLEKLTIKFTNNNEFTNPKPPVFWGGDYINYLRVIVPVRAEIKDFQNYDIEIRDKFKIVGMWVKISAKETKSVEIFYELPTIDNKYSVLVKRQPGIESFSYKLIYNGKIIKNTQIDRDLSIVVQ